MQLVVHTVRAWARAADDPLTTGCTLGPCPTLQRAPSTRALALPRRRAPNAALADQADTSQSPGRLRSAHPLCEATPTDLPNPAPRPDRPTGPGAARLARRPSDTTNWPAAATPRWSLSAPRPADRADTSQSPRPLRSA